MEMGVWEIIDLIGTLTTIILGVTAICLSLYLYRRSSELDASTKTLLSRVEASTSKTELASRDVLSPMIELLGSQFTQRSVAKLEEVLAGQAPQEKQAAREAFIEEINSLLGTLRNEIAKLRPSAAPEIAVAAEKLTGVGLRTMPGSPSYDWTEFIRRIRDMEATRDFLSVKWLRETRFSGDPEAQEALQIAIDRRILLTRRVDNPKNPEFPTLVCKLNREHEIVKEILKAMERD
ncbi:MAG: hypothetical protein ACFFCW_40160 [Candidatus Hodarchaeota archaeon]